MPADIVGRIFFTWQIRGAARDRSAGVANGAGLTWATPRTPRVKKVGVV